MTTQELLKPRYKVIADYPRSIFNVGAILESSGDCAGIDRTGSGVFATSVYKPEKYPHLFRKLEWWEERKLEEMPGYVKVVSAKSSLFIGDVHKVKLWYFYDIGEAACTLIESKTGPYSYNASHLQPATETEYNEYIKTINQ